VHRLHDDEADIGARIDSGHKQVHVFEHATSWLVQDVASKSLVFVDPTTLLPERVTWRCLDSGNDDIADFARSMATNNLDGPW